MGCDIHPHMEMKIDGKWRYVGELIRGRNYVLFGTLSGVRVNGTNVFDAPAPSLPQDVSKEIDEEYQGWNGIAHSLTIIEDIDRLNEAVGGLYAENWVKVARDMLVVADDVRIIAWYDN